MSRNESTAVPGHAEPSSGAAKAQSALAQMALENSLAIRAGARPDLLDRAQQLQAEIAAHGASIPCSAAWQFGFAHHARGEYSRAIAYFESADLSSAEARTSDRALVLAGHASSRWAQGDAAGARARADEALALAVEAGDEQALAAAWVAQALAFVAEGDRTANLRAYETALTHAELASDVLTMVRVRSNMGSMHSEEGRNQAALVEVDEAINLAESIDAGVIAAIAFINRAEALLALGRLDEAVVEARVAVEIYRAAKSPLHVFALLLEAEIHRIRGNATQAQVRYREAIDRAKQTGDAQVLTVAFAGIARTLIADDSAAAVETARLALEQPNALGDVAAQLSVGWVALAVGDNPGALEWARRAVREAGRRRDVSALADALELGALARWTKDSGAGEAVPMLEEAAGIWLETGDPIRIAVNRALRARVDGDRTTEDVALRALQELGVRIDVFRIAGPLQAIGQVNLPETSVRMLGSFAVLHRGEALTHDAWPSRKSREVVRILAARHGRPISRETLGELLWPGVNDTSARLSVALSNARIALDSERQFAADHYISTANSQVALNPATVLVDVAEFEQVARAGLRAAAEGTADALATLQAAAALYPALFLADEPHADWVVTMRDELRDLATSVKRELARLLIDDSDPERPIQWLVSLLDDDPFDEAAHRKLIALLAGARRFGEARRAYRNYVARMTELDVEPLALQELAGSRLGT